MYTVGFSNYMYSVCAFSTGFQAKTCIKIRADCSSYVTVSQLLLSLPWSQCAVCDMLLYLSWILCMVWVTCYCTCRGASVRCGWHAAVALGVRKLERAAHMSGHTTAKYWHYDVFIHTSSCTHRARNAGGGGYKYTSTQTWKVFKCRTMWCYLIFCLFNW